MQLNEATSYCQSLNANQILPRNKQESDDLVSALISLDLAFKDGKTRNVSIGIYRSKEGKWYDSEGQLISYFNWLPDEPDDIDGNENYAGFQISGLNASARWADHSSYNQLNVVCLKIASRGKKNH